MPASDADISTWVDSLDSGALRILLKAASQQDRLVAESVRETYEYPGELDRLVTLDFGHVVARVREALGLCLYDQGQKTHAYQGETKTQAHQKTNRTRPPGFKAARVMAPAVVDAVLRSLDAVLAQVRFCSPYRTKRGAADALAGVAHVVYWSRTPLAARVWAACQDRLGDALGEVLVLFDSGSPGSGTGTSSNELKRSSSWLKRKGGLQGCGHSGSGRGRGHARLSERARLAREEGGEWLHRLRMLAFLNDQSAAWRELEPMLDRLEEEGERRGGAGWDEDDADDDDVYGQVDNNKDSSMLQDAEGGWAQVHPFNAEGGFLVESARSPGTWDESSNYEDDSTSDYGDGSSAYEDALEEGTSGSARLEDVPEGVESSFWCDESLEYLECAGEKDLDLLVDGAGEFDDSLETVGEWSEEQNALHVKC